MKRPIHNRGRRRVMLTALFILIGTVAMIGPTQAVSGIVTASVAVMETFNEVLGDADRSSKSIAAIELRALPEWSDTPLTPDFSGIVGTLPPQPESELSLSMEAMPALTASGSESNNTGAHSNGFGAGNWSGNQGGGAAPSGLAGSSGMALGGGSWPFADTPVGRELTAMDLTLESSPASFAAGDLDGNIEGFGGLPGDPVALGPGGPGPGSLPSVSPGGADDSGTTGDTFPIPGVALVPPGGPPSASSPAPTVAGGSIPSVAGGPSAGAPTAPPSVNNVPSPAVVEDLLDDLGLPATAAAELDSLRNASAGRQSGTGVFQVPEPSVLLLGAVGTAAVARRYRRRNADRRS